MEKDYTARSYKLTIALAFIMHIVFFSVFWYLKSYPMFFYNVFLTFLYGFFYCLIGKGYYRLTIILIHIEVCIFVTVSTLCLGWNWGFWIYLVALSSLIYFNPLKRKNLIYIFPVAETLLFFILRTYTLERPIVFSGELFSYYANFLGCFTMIFVGTLASKVAFNSVTQAHRQIAYDKLTGTFCREHFILKARQEMKDAVSLSGYYLVLTNISEFKYYNEMFGNEKGDEVLAALGDLLNKMVDAAIGVGRVSGNEFAVLMKKEQFDEKTINNVIEIIQNQFSNTIFRLRIHVGVYEIRDAGESVSAMIDKAKIAIDSFKNEYIASVAYYDNRMLEDSLKEKRILGEFEYALEDGQFCFYLQPQTLRDGACFGAEALVRWNHPSEGIIAPNNFIPILERTGLIWKLDQYIWEQAAKKLQQWKAQGREDMSISINMSPRDFYYLDIYEVMTSLVEKYQINPRLLKLEITETALMTDFNKQIALVQRLQDYGFQVELDDFGSGYSSLNTLKDIRVDVLKIDMKFLQETGQVERSWSILNMIISLAKQIGMLTLTEGVETKEQLANLTTAGCDMFQGYYFSKPIPVELFEKEYM